MIARKKAAAEGRVRSFSPDECKALGLEFPSEWSEAGGAKAESSKASKASAGLDALDLPPEATPIELEPERVDPPPPAEVAPDPLPSAEPVEVAPPAVVSDAPADPDASSATPAGPPGSPAAALAALPPSVLTSLLATACTRAWCGGVLFASTPRGCKPIPLTEAEVAEIDRAMRMVLDRYLPALPTDHPELFALLLATALPIFDRRVVRAHLHERIELEGDDDDDDGDEQPTPPPTPPRPARPSNAFTM